MKPYLIYKVFIETNILGDKKYYRECISKWADLMLAQSWVENQEDKEMYYIEICEKTDDLFMEAQ